MRPDNGKPRGSARLVGVLWCREGEMLRALGAAPGPIVALILSFLCPTELSLFLGGLRLPPHRVALILLFPFALYRLISRRDIRVRSFDIGFLAFAAWSVVVYAMHSGQEGVVYGGSLALESFGAYVVARAYVRDGAAMLATTRMMVLAIALAAVFALPETLLGQLYTHDFLRQLTGYQHPVGIEQRLGLTRAYGTFDHPIHYGTFCAGLFAVLYFAETKRWQKRKRTAFVTGATILGLSSAPILCLCVQGALMTAERVTRGLKARGYLAVAVLSGLYIGISLVSTRGPFAIIATGFTLDPWTGFYRLQIWEHGLGNVLANPWTGIGLGEWERPQWMVSSTVDAFWLVTMMRTGLPAFLLLVGSVLLIARGVVWGRLRIGDRYLAGLGTGWLISLIALVLVGCTVHYWNVVHTYFFFFLGLGGWLADPVRKKKKAQRASVPLRSPMPHDFANPVPALQISGTASLR